MRHDRQPVLLKSVNRLGNSEQQGRLFGFFETGRGIVDTVVAFSALAVFTGLAVAYWVLKQASGSIPYCDCRRRIIFFVLNDKEEALSVEVKDRHRKTQYDLGAERQNHLAYRF